MKDKIVKYLYFLIIVDTKVKNAKHLHASD